MKILLLIVAALAMTEPLIATNAVGASIYISTRIDGLPGSGTATDPYNGSTEAQFDALMNAIPPNTTINLSAGTFLSDGADVFSLKSGWTLKGAGMGKTILKLAGHSSPNNKKHDNLYGVTVTNIQISNLTCDGNATGWSWPAHEAVGGIFINNGSNILIDHVEVINCYGDGVQGFEQFSILVSGTSQLLGTNCVIQNCLTHQYAPGASYTNGPMISYVVNPQIINCTDDGAGHGFGFAGTTGGVITGCSTSAKTYTAFYTDTGSNSDMTIESNTFTAAQIPVQFNSALTENGIKILNNALQSSNTGSGEAGIVLSGTGGGNDIQIIDNTYAYVGTLNNGLILNNGQGFTDLDVENNSTNVGIVGAGGVREDITNVATNIWGNKFYEPLADLADNNTVGAPAANQDASSNSTAASTPPPTNTTPSTPASTASNAAKTASSTTSSAAANAAKTVTNPPTPQKTVAAIAKMPAGIVRMNLLKGAFAQWTRQNPSAAARYAESMPPGADRLAALDTVASQWASTDAAGATDWVTSLPPDSEETQHVLHKVAETWANQAMASSAE